MKSPRGVPGVPPMGPLGSMASMTSALGPTGSMNSMGATASPSSRAPSDAFRTMRAPPNPGPGHRHAFFDVDELMRDYKARDSKYDGRVSRRLLYSLLVGRGVHPQVCAQYVENFFRKADFRQDGHVFMVEFCSEYVRKELYSSIKVVAAELRRALNSQEKSNNLRDISLQSEMELEATVPLITMLEMLVARIGTTAAIREIEDEFVVAQGGLQRRHIKPNEYKTWAIKLRELRAWYMRKNQSTADSLKSMASSNNTMKLSRERSRPFLGKAALPEVSPHSGHARPDSRASGGKGGGSPAGTADGSAAAASAWASPRTKATGSGSGSSTSPSISRSAAGTRPGSNKAARPSKEAARPSSKEGNRPQGPQAGAKKKQRDLEKTARLADKKRRQHFPTITIVCDYSDKRYGEQEEEEVGKVKEVAPPTTPPPAPDPKKKRGGAAPSRSAFKEIYRPKAKLAPEPQFTEEGWLTCTHDFRQGPLKLGKLKRIMLSKNKTQGVTFVGLQPHVKTVRVEGDIADYDEFGGVVVKADVRDSPWYISMVQFDGDSLDYDQDSQRVFEHGKTYQLVYDDTTRDLFMSVELKRKRQLKELFEEIDEDKTGRVSLTQVLRYYETIGDKQLVMLEEMYGSDLDRIEVKMKEARRLNAVMTELFQMRKEENRGDFVRFMDFLVMHAKGRAMLGLGRPGAASNPEQLEKYRQATATFPFSAMTSLERPATPPDLEVEARAAAEAEAEAAAKAAAAAKPASRPPTTKGKKGKKR